MPTVIFDFDSTIISCESLEKILEKKLAHQPEVLDRIKQITEEGIRGEIPFSESLDQRLKLAAPTRKDAIAFGEEAIKWLTPGVETLISDLKRERVDIWMISGGIQESLEAIGEKLGISGSQVQGVKLLWDAKGNFSGIDEADPFSRSKFAGVQKLARNWNSPTIGIGDSMSDYHLYEKGAVSHFILFTQHFRCQEVLEKGALEAKDISQLRRFIKGIINNHAVI
ncbi:MAG: HAD-IB family phosphatase [Waddliaceae bacterium]